MSYTRNTIGEQVARHVVEEWQQIRDELGGTVILYEDKMGRPVILDELAIGDFGNPAHRQRALEWLRPRPNDFINVLRPRVKVAVADLELESR